MWDVCVIVLRYDLYLGVAALPKCECVDSFDSFIFNVMFTYSGSVGQGKKSVCSTFMTSLLLCILHNNRQPDNDHMWTSRVCKLPVRHIFDRKDFQVRNASFAMFQPVRDYRALEYWIRVRCKGNPRQNSQIEKHVVKLIRLEWNSWSFYFICDVNSQETIFYNLNWFELIKIINYIF